MQTVFRFEIKPTIQQQRMMFHTLKLCRRLYNWALSECQRVYKETSQGLTYNKQQNQLPAYVKEHSEYKEIHSQVLQDVLKRLDFAYKRFFEREAGYPRYKNRDHYTSFTYPQIDVVRKTFARPGYIYLPKIGFVKMIPHRDFEPGKVSRVNVKYHGSKWFINLTKEVETPQQSIAGRKSVGIDVGLEHFAALSNSTFIETPAYYRKAEKKLAKLQRRLTRKKKGSHNRGKAKAKVAKLHARVANQRKDFLHKASLAIVREYDIIVMEDLRIRNMVRNRRLSKSIHDAGWGQFGGYIGYKAERYGKKHVKVNPSGTSQECLCGVHVQKDLSVRLHQCPACGLVAPRDQVSAILIERRGLSLLAA